MWREVLSGLSEQPAGEEEGVCDDPGLAALVLQWVQVVCAGYGVAVENFSRSLADGAALCLLVHHYKPELLPLAVRCRWAGMRARRN